MTETVGDFFVEPLHQWGVRRIYGYPAASTACSARCNGPRERRSNPASSTGRVFCEPEFRVGIRSYVRVF